MKLALRARRSAVVLPFVLALSASSAAAQQVMWRDNPISGKVVGLTYGTSGWNAAEAQAVAYGGHLVTIRSQAEQDWLVANFSAQWSVGINADGPWMGLHELGGQGSPWVWTSGESLSFQHWWGNEPNNAGGNEVAVHFLPSSYQYKWNDAHESFGVRSLVEVQQRPARSWSWPTAYATGARPVYGCAFDMDGDGDMDYASPDRDSGQISLWRNNGTGVFAGAGVIGGAGSIYTVVPLDHDGDGDQDLYGPDANGRLLLARNGGASWNLEQLALVPACYGVTVADLNKDSRIDIITSSVGSDDRIRVFLRQSDGSLAMPSVFGPFFDEAHQTSVADLDGDGYPDVLLAGGGTRLLRGSATGALTDAGNLGAGRNFGAIGADLNADGSLELVISRIDIDRLEVWSRTGNGPLSNGNYTKIQDLACGDGPHWASASDLDGDGDLDMVVPSYLSDTVHILRNTNGMLAQDHVLIGQDYALCNAVVDLNGDAKADIITSNHLANAFSVHINQSKFDCNGNGIDDPIDIASGAAVDCNGNGRPDSCDLAFGFSQDSNGNGLLDECEPTLVSLSPATRAAFSAGTVAVATTNVPNGTATLTLNSPSFAQPIVRTFAVANNAGSVTLPALGSPSASDVVASGTISFTDALGNTVVTDVTPDVFTWDVPRIAASIPSNAPFDQTTSVLFTLEGHVATSGVGSARFGGSPPQAAYLFQFGGQTVVNTVAPAQPAPGPVDVLLQFGNELTLAQRGFVFLGPGVTNLSVTSGWQAGGEALDVELYGFAPNVPVDVIFGSGAGAVSVAAVPSGVAAQSFLSLTTPYVPLAGALDFTVVQNAGLPSEKRVVSPGAWLAEAPRIASVSPTDGFQGGGDLVTLTLEGFPAGVATRVELGSQVYSVTNSGTLDHSTASLTTTLAPIAGPVDVTVRQGLGGPTPLDATLAAGFNVLAPTFTGVSPSSGPREGGTQVVAQTSGFDATIPAQVQLGGTTLVGTVTGSGPSQTVSFRTTLATPGLTDVTISQGVLTSTLSGAFTFNAPIVSNYCQSKLTSASTLPIIGFTGSPSASTGDFAITLSNALPNKNCLYFYGATPSNVSFYGGKLCVSTGGIQRGPTTSTNSASAVSVPMLVSPAMVGTNRYIQWWFRDPADPFTVGLSGGLRVLGFYP